MKSFRFKLLKAFTLIELLIVIVIIGILAASLIPRIKGMQVKSRDTKRISDMRTIQTALEIYHNTYGYLPRTATYNEVNYGNRDYSSQSGFLTFLQTAGILSSVPVDPINNAISDNRSYYAYKYFCYPVEGTSSLRWGTGVPFAVVTATLERPFDLQEAWRLYDGSSESHSNSGAQNLIYMIVPVDRCAP